MSGVLGDFFCVIRFEISTLAGALHLAFIVCQVLMRDRILTLLMQIIVV